MNGRIRLTERCWRQIVHLVNDISLRRHPNRCRIIVRCEREHRLGQFLVEPLVEIRSDEDFPQLGQTSIESLSYPFFVPRPRMDQLPKIDRDLVLPFKDKRKR